MTGKAGDREARKQRIRRVGRVMAFVSAVAGVLLLAIASVIDTGQGKPVDPADIIWAIIAVIVIGFLVWEVVRERRHPPR
jgi:Kef-type K+ transport system membrane component KefB